MDGSPTHTHIGRRRGKERERDIERQREIKRERESCTCNGRISKLKMHYSIFYNLEGKTRILIGWVSIRVPVSSLLAEFQ